MPARTLPIFIVCGALAVAISASSAQPTPPANPLDAVPEKMPFDVPCGPPIA